MGPIPRTRVTQTSSRVGAPLLAKVEAETGWLAAEVRTLRGTPSGVALPPRSNERDGAGASLARQISH